MYNPFLPILEQAVEVQVRASSAQMLMTAFCFKRSGLKEIELRFCRLGLLFALLRNSIAFRSVMKFKSLYVRSEMSNGNWGRTY